MTLNWTATGDDGNKGTAQSYDLRYSTTPLTPSTWAAATAITPAPTPKAAGSAESHTVAGLSSNTTYYFGCKVYDDEGNASLLSNVAAITTGDAIPPAAVTGLQAAVVDPTAGGAVPLTTRSYSSFASSSTLPPNLLDARDSTRWKTAARTGVFDFPRDPCFIQRKP